MQGAPANSTAAQQPHAFETLPGELQYHSRWRAWAAREVPEDERLPADWKGLDGVQRLLVLRCLRPDRLPPALDKFVAAQLGPRLALGGAAAAGDGVAEAVACATPTTPVFFLVSPGADPLARVDGLGEAWGLSPDRGTLLGFSLGRGHEDDRALDAVRECRRRGGWVSLANVHLAGGVWLRALERCLDEGAAARDRAAAAERRRTERRRCRAAARAAAAAAEAAAAEEEEGEARPSPPGVGVGDELLRTAREMELEDLRSGRRSSWVLPKAESEAAGSDGDDDGVHDRYRGMAGARGCADPVAGTDGDGDEEPAFVESEDDSVDSGAGGAGRSCLEREAEDLIIAGRPHEGFRIFLSAEAGVCGRRGGAEEKAEEAEGCGRGGGDLFAFRTAARIPLGILQRCTTLTSETPAGLKANLLRAFARFADEPWEDSCRPAAFKAVAFALCWFHAVVVGRGGFGPLGWAAPYAFSEADVAACADVLAAQVERPAAAAAVPWEDFRFAFGEVVYGGHVSDAWDRRVCAAYLRRFLSPALLETAHAPPSQTTEGAAAVAVAAACRCPAPDFSSYVEGVLAIERLPQESPAAYGYAADASSAAGLHAPRTHTFLADLAAARTAAAPHGSDEAAPATAALRVADALLDGLLPAEECAAELAGAGAADDGGCDGVLHAPLRRVFATECWRMAALVRFARTGLERLRWTLRGGGECGQASEDVQLTGLLAAAQSGRVPAAWEAAGFPTARPLASWGSNVAARCGQLRAWLGDGGRVPGVTRLDHLLSPRAFPAALCQGAAAQRRVPVDSVEAAWEVTRKSFECVESAARSGCHVYGLKLCGARWDVASSCIDVASGCAASSGAAPADGLYTVLPVATVRVMEADSVDRRGLYECPVYATERRGSDYALSVWLGVTGCEGAADAAVLAGVACVLDVPGVVG